MSMRAVLVGLCLLALAGCAKGANLPRSDAPALGGSLEGGPWLVEDLNGARVPAGLRVDISFEPGDQNTGVVFGTSGCNRFRGGWQQTAAKIKLGPLAGTMMMCEPGKMETERLFMQTLEAVRVVTFDSGGTAVLTAADGQRIKLRREAK